MLAATTFAALAANTAEITSTDLRNNAAFDNIKASWGKAISVGDLKADLKCDYDYNANKDFLSEATLTGDLVEDSDMKVSYEVTHDFSSKNTNVKLTAVTSGTTLGAEYDTDSQLKEVSAQRNLDVGDRDVDTEVTWVVASKTARVKLMTALGDKDSATATIDYDTDGGDTSYEVTVNRDLDDGKSVEVTFDPESKDLDIEYVDTEFESGATWTANVAVPLEASNIADAATLKLKRSWTW